MPKAKPEVAAAPIEKQIKEEKAEEKKIEEATAVEEKKEAKKEKVKKTEAVMRGKDLPISKKHSMAICDLIRGKKIEPMILELEQIAKLKKPIVMRGEIPHRHGKIMSGRYPVNACKVFIKLLKCLNANASVNSLENVYLAIAIANDASRPFKRGGSMRFKRTNVLLIARERKQAVKEEKKEVKIEKENKEEKK